MDEESESIEEVDQFYSTVQEQTMVMSENEEVVRLLEDLNKAHSDGDHAKVEVIIDGLLNDEEYKDYHVLKLALARGQDDIALKLIEYGCRCFKSMGINEECYVPLHFAVPLGNALIVQKILQDENFSMDNKNSPDLLTLLHIAAMRNFYEMIDLLLAKMMTMPEIPEVKDVQRASPLHFACMLDKVDYVRFFLEDRGYAINDSVPITSEYWQGYTPLHIATEFANASVVEYLLNVGANVNAEDRFGETALHVAVDFVKYYGNKQRHKLDRQIDVIKLLLERGCNANLKNKNGVTPIFHVLNACEEYVENDNYWSTVFEDYIHDLQNSRQVQELIDVLVSHGADVNATNKDGLTLLHEISKVIKWSSFEVDLVKFLITKGADVNATSKSGKTPLHFAVKRDHGEDKVSVLIDCGARVNQRDFKAMTPLHFAAIYQTSNSLYNLLKFGADPNARNDRGRTALQILVMGQHSVDQDNLDLLGNDSDASSYEANAILDVVELLKFCCHVDATDCNGMSALHLACYQGKFRFIRTLLDYGANIGLKDDKGHTPLHYAYARLQAQPETEQDWREKYSREEWNLHSFCGLIDQVIMLEAIDHRISEKNKKYCTGLKERLFPKNYEDFFPDKCKVEISRLKRVKIDSCTSLFSLLRKNPNQIALQVNKNKLKNVMGSVNIEQEYPVYGPWLKIQFERGVKRSKVLPEAYDSFQLLTGMNLPYLCRDEILLYLSVKNLNALNKAAKLSAKKKK